MKPLVSALRVPKLADACRVLFVSGDNLTLSSELHQIGLVTLQGAQNGQVENADLLISQTQLELVKIGQEALPRLIRTFMEPIVSAGVDVASIENAEMRESVLTAKVVEKVKSQTASQETFKYFLPYLGGAIKPFAQLLVASLFKFYLERHNTQRQLLPEFSNVVSSLEKIGLLSPFLNLAMCPKCDNYEIIFSRRARFSPACHKCGSLWPVLMVNEFPDSFALLKRANKDLAIFISMYLRSHSTFPVNIFPNAEFNVRGGKAEVDVYIPETVTGVECKCYTNNLAIADSTIQSEAAKMKRQLENYARLGIKRVLIVTNYGDVDIGKLSAALMAQMKTIKNLKEVRLVGSELSAFKRILDEESNNINDSLSAGVQREFEHRMSKQLAKSDGDV